jgi:hypothetical protein
MTPAIAGATPPITVASLSPTSGPSGGGTSVAITGSDFTGATAVTFGSVPAASFTVIDDSDIIAVTQQSESGIVDVLVTGPDGQSSPVTADQYTAITQPPDPPLPVAAQATGVRSVTVTWQPPVFDGGSPISYYYVQLSRQLQLSGQVSPATCSGTPVQCVATISGLNVGSVSFAVVAVNSAGLSSLSAVSNSVNAFANPHVRLFHPIPQSSFGGGAINLQIVAWDNDYTPITYSATGLPLGLAIDPTTGVISGTITGPVNSRNTIMATIMATDGYTSSVTTSAWHLTPGLRIVRIPRQISTVGVAVVPLAVVATDLAGATPLTFSASGLPPGLTIDPSTGLISGTPTQHGGTHVVITGTDAIGGYDQLAFNWIVQR